MNMILKRLWAFLLACVCLCAAVGTSVAEATDEEIIQAVVERFLPLTEVPRPSHHEEKIGQYLLGRAREHGLDPLQDDFGNIIIDVPATPGMEDRPLVILQAHMDMVCVAAKGVDYDPLNDPIKAVVTDETITADGTSLGADDGIGLALSFCVTDGLIAHGPVRVIYTVDEEDGLEGVFHLDPAHVADAKYLINLDAEQSDAIIVSTASGVLLQFEAAMESKPAAGYDTAVTLSVGGLLGGHSGVEIDKHRINATRALAELLICLNAENIESSVALLTGGTASNAIPSDASALVLLHSEDMERLEAFSASWQQEKRLLASAFDPGLTVTIEPAELPGETLTAQAQSGMLSFILELPTGVYTVSYDYAGLVESSSNLGIFRCSPDGLSAKSSIRSSDAGRQEELVTIQQGIAENRGYTVTREKFADPWKFDPDSHLLAIAENAYRGLNGSDPYVMALHAGLECGTFAVYNPDLDMIAVGPDLKDVHSPNETCYLKSVPMVWRFLERVLSDLD